LNYAHKNQNNFNAIFVPAQLNERIPPNSRHEGEDLEILKRRHAVYQEAQEQHPLVGLEKLEIGKKWKPLNFMA